MTNWYLKGVGRSTGELSASLFGLSEEYRAFLQAGYVCQSCGQTLMHPWGVADLLCYNTEGKRVGLLLSTFCGDYFACPKCGHTWWIREKSARSQSLSTQQAHPADGEKR